MTRWFRPVLTFTLLIGFAGVAAGQPKAGEKAGEPKAADTKADAIMSAPVMTGKVTEVSAAAKTFTLTDQGKAMTFSGADLKALPKVGDVVDVTYNSTIGGQLRATTVKSSKSNTSD